MNPFLYYFATPFYSTWKKKILYIGLTIGSGQLWSKSNNPNLSWSLCHSPVEGAEVYLSFF
jgi:hypothetical protein